MGCGTIGGWYSGATNHGQHLAAVQQSGENALEVVPGYNRRSGLHWYAQISFCFDRIAGHHTDVIALLASGAADSESDPLNASAASIPSPAVDGSVEYCCEMPIALFLSLAFAADSVVIGDDHTRITGYIDGLDFNRAGELAAYVDNQVLIWSIPDGILLDKISNEAAEKRGFVEPRYGGNSKGNVELSIDYTGNAVMLRVPDGEERARIPTPKHESVEGVAFLGDDVVVNMDSGVFRYSSPSWKRTQLAPRMSGRNMDISDDGWWLAVAGTSGRLALWDLKQEKLVGRGVGLDAAVEVLRWSADGSRLLAADGRGNSFLHDLARDETTQRLRPGRLVDADLSPDGSTVAWADGERVRLLDAMSGKELASSGFEAAALDYGSDGSLWAVDPRKVAELDPATGGRIKSHGWCQGYCGSADRLWVNPRRADVVVGEQLNGLYGFRRHDLQTLWPLERVFGGLSDKNPSAAAYWDDEKNLRIALLGGYQADLRTLVGKDRRCRTGDGSAVALSEHGDRFAVAVYDDGDGYEDRVIADIEIRRTSDCSLLDRVNAEVYVTEVSFSPDGNKLAFGTESGGVRIASLEPSTPKERPKPFTRAERSIAGDAPLSAAEGHKVDITFDSNFPATNLSADGVRLLVSYGRDNFGVYDTAAKRSTLHKTKACVPANCYQMAWSPDGSEAVALDDGLLLIVDPSTGKALKQAKYEQTATLLNPSVDWGANGIIATSDGFLWDPSRKVAPRRFATIEAQSLSLSPDGRRALTVERFSEDIKIWSIDSGELLRQITGVNAVWSADGKWLATAYQGTVRIKNAETYENVQWLEGHEVAWGMAFSPDSKRIATGISFGQIALWDVATGRPQLRLEGGFDEGDSEILVAGMGSNMAWRPNMLMVTESSGLRYWETDALAP